jgi:hypothetical protein
MHNKEDQKLINEWLKENEIEILKTRKPRKTTSIKIKEPSSFEKKITKYSQNWRLQK